MESFEQLIASYNFTELRVLMQYPSKQNLMREILNSNFQQWVKEIQFQSINLLHFSQWLTNFITANQENAKFILEYLPTEFGLQNIMLSQDYKIQKIFLVFVHNMLKSGIDKEQFLFNSIFANHIVVKIVEAIQSQEQELLEWVTYCFVAIFSQTYKQSYLEILSQNNNGELLDFLFQMLQKTINDKVYPSLIAELQPKSADIRELYSNTNKIGLQISKLDLIFLKQSVITDNQKYKFYSLITFMGGYHCEVQSLFFPQEFYAALSKLNSEKDQETISVLLRFIANMVHINRVAWKELSDNLNLLNPIIHLTNMHNEHQQREWSTMIVRNLCESDELRDYLQQCK